MQSSSTDADTGSGGEVTCRVSVATHRTLMTQVTVFQVLDIFKIVLGGRLKSHRGPSSVGYLQP